MFVPCSSDRSTFFSSPSILLDFRKGFHLCNQFFCSKWNRITSIEKKFANFHYCYSFHINFYFFLFPGFWELFSKNFLHTILEVKNLSTQQTFHSFSSLYPLYLNLQFFLIKSRLYWKDKLFIVQETSPAFLLQTSLEVIHNFEKIKFL